MVVKTNTYALYLTIVKEVEDRTLIQGHLDKVKKGERALPLLLFSIYCLPGTQHHNLAQHYFGNVSLPALFVII